MLTPAQKKRVPYIADQLSLGELLPLYGQPLWFFAKACGVSILDFQSNLDRHEIVSGLNSFRRVASVRGRLDSDKAFRAWLSSPHKKLSGWTPLSLISQGEMEKVVAAVEG